MLLSGRKGLRNKYYVSSQARNIYYILVFSFYALYKLRPKQQILCFIQINNGQSLSCQNHYSANLMLRDTTNISYSGGKKDIVSFIA